MPEETPTISIVVPTLNEAANLPVVLPALPEVHEVIVVDGHSVDGTIATARRVRPEVKIVRQTRRGKGNALTCGFAAATGDIVVMFDADGSADAAEIPLFVRALTEGADYAKGSRFCGTGIGMGGSADISRLRMAGNAGLNALANRLFGTQFSDLCYGYNAFWRRILPLLRLPPVAAPGAVRGKLLWGDGFEIETVLSCRVAAARLRVAEVPSFEHRRLFGDTNLRTFVDGSRVLRTILFERVMAAYAPAGSRWTDLDLRTRGQIMVPAEGRDRAEPSAAGPWRAPGTHTPIDTGPPTSRRSRVASLAALRTMATVQRTKGARDDS